jgi:predicted transposase YdaD
MEQRIDVEAPAEAGVLWSATYILMGLRFPREFAGQLLKGVRAMKESDTYQAILEEGKIEGKIEGKAEEAKAILLRLGEKRFGVPDEPTRTRIEAIVALSQLEGLIVRLLEVESWAELFSGVGG